MIRKYLQSPFTSRNDITSYRQLRFYENILAPPQPCTNNFFLHVCYIWVIDQVWGHDGWILAKFFFCAFMDRDEVEIHKRAKKESRPISSHLDQTSLVNKGFSLYGFRGNFSCGNINYCIELLQNNYFLRYIVFWLSPIIPIWVSCQN